MPRQKQVALLKEALRIARKVVLVDSEVPLPRSTYGIALRLVEASGGPEHYRPFADYLEAVGIEGILADPDVEASVVQRCVFWHGCRRMVTLDGQAKPAS